MFEDELRSATVEAVEQLQVVAVLGPDMRRLMVEHPGISTRLVIALGRRLRETNERLTRSVLPDGAEPRGSGRSASWWRRRSRREELDGSGRAVTATQADLAQLAGSSRESASRFLAVLERAGVISQGRGHLVVHDAEALKQYVF